MQIALIYAYLEFHLKLFLFQVELPIIICEYVYKFISLALLIILKNVHLHTDIISFM